MPVHVTIGLFFVFLLLLTLADVYYKKIKRQTWIRHRLRPVHRENRHPGKDRWFIRLIKEIGYQTGPKKAAADRLKQQLSWAGYRYASAPEMFCGTRSLAAVVLLAGAVLSGLITGVTLMTAFAVFMILAAANYLPQFWLRYRVMLRTKSIFRELPDTLDLIVLCVEAGLGFEMALFRVSRELKAVAPVLSREFAQYFYETRGGLSRTEALANMKTRNRSAGLDAFVDVVLQSMRFGTDVAGALRVHSESMRTERHQIAEEKGGKIAVKLTLPLVFFVLPALLIIILGPAVLRLMDAFIK